MPRSIARPAGPKSPSPTAAKQLDTVTSEAELHALERALVVTSVDPEIGEPIPGDTADPRLHVYADEVERVRLLYRVTALRTVVVVAYLEVAGGAVDEVGPAAGRGRRLPRQAALWR